MTDRAIRALVGPVALDVVNHAWWDDDTFVSRRDAQCSGAVVQLSGGRLDEAIEVRINRLVVESDVTLIVGPVLPHEVIGFSGGNKYLFPGLSGQELIDVTHWLGALITSSEIIGTRGHHPCPRPRRSGGRPWFPVNATRCVSWWTTPRAGSSRSPSANPSAAWTAAADVAAADARHVPRPPGAPGAFSRAAPVPRSLDRAPRVSTRSSRSWPTGARWFSTHRTSREIAAMHPALMDIGYHCRDFFLAQWDRYRHFPRGELRTRHTFSARDVRRRSVASTSGCGSRWPPGSPRTSSSGPTWATSIRPGRYRGLVLGPRCPRRSRCGRGALPSPLMMSVDDGSPHSPGYTRPIWERMASSVVASAMVSARGMSGLSVRPSDRQRCTCSISNRRPFPS